MDFLTLLRIELKRSRVWLLVAVLLAAFLVTDMRKLLVGPGGGVTWYWIGGSAAALTGTFPFGVAFASWYAGRARRNQLKEIERSNRWLGLGSHAPALLSMIMVLVVTVVPVFAVVSRRIWLRSIDQTGGPPPGPYPWLQIVVILFAFAAFMVWGYWLGDRLGSVLAPIASAAAMLLLLQIPRKASTLDDPISPIGAIIPTWISHEMAPYIGDHVYLPLAGWGIAWFSLLGLIPILLLRK